MQKLDLLNKRDIKKIQQIISDQWGSSFTFDSYAVLKGIKNKIYIINKEFAGVDLGSLRVNSYGLYFGELKDKYLRLSIEGSQFVGKTAKKNIVELPQDQLRTWLKGGDLEYTGNCRGFVIIASTDNFAGTGKVKEGQILNFVPKIRRLPY